MIAKTSTLFALSALFAASMPLASAQFRGPSYNATAQVWPTEKCAAFNNCTYSQVCCEQGTWGTANQNDNIAQCAMFGYTRTGHSRPKLGFCPSVAQGGGGIYTKLVNESNGRAANCCANIAAGLVGNENSTVPTEWDYDGIRNGLVGCSQSNTCAYGNQQCCYNTFNGDHQCYLWENLPLIKKTYGSGFARCPTPTGDGWVSPIGEEDGRQNHCCEDLPGTSPICFQGLAVSGNQCWLEGNQIKQTTMPDGSVYTGSWIGFKPDDVEKYQVLTYLTEEAAVADGCVLGCGAGFLAKPAFGLVLLVGIVGSVLAF